MKPILYYSNEVQFVSNGIGILSDAVSCFVDAEINSIYEIEVKYPVEGIHFAAIKKNSIILAKPDPISKPQPFRIYRITKPMGGIIKVYGRHIAYDLAGIPIAPFTTQNVKEAFAFLKSKAAVSCPFGFATDIDAEKPFEVATPKDCWSILGKTQNSILSTYGGEYEFDGFSVRLRERIGEARDFCIRYGKNLTTVEQDENCGDVYTGIYPYWKGKDGNIVTLSEKSVMANGVFDHVKIQTVDMTNFFDGEPSQAQLREKAVKYIQDHGIGVPEVSLTVSYVDLGKTEEYKGILQSEGLRIGDSVSVYFPKMEIHVTERVVRTRYNVLLDRNESISVGRVKRTISDTIAANKNKIDQESIHWGYAFGAADAKIEKLTTDSVQLTARVDDAEAGLKATVKMDLYQDAAGNLYHIAYTYVDENGNTVYVDENGVKHYNLSFVGGYASASVMAAIGEIAAGLESKVSISTFTDLEGRVTSIETAEASLSARITEAESSLALKATSESVEELNGEVSKIRTAQADLTTRVGNAESTLSLKASSKSVTDLAGRVSTVEEAQTNLSTRVGNAEASISLKASSKSVTDLAGRVSTVEESTVAISADIISLKGRVDLTGSVSVSNGIANFSSNVYVDGVVMSYTNYIGVGGNFYGPTTITSTNGPIEVLAL